MFANTRITVAKVYANAWTIRLISVLLANARSLRIQRPLVLVNGNRLPKIVLSEDLINAEAAV